MPRYFTLQQAERVLPHVEAAIRAAIGLKSEYLEASESLHDISRKVMLSGGMAVNREQVGRLRKTREDSGELLQTMLTEIEEFGCVVKDLDMGLLDFPTLYQDREVYLCWRLGERSIQFWHGVDEGFQGRKEIDGEFLANHRGDSVS